MSRKSKVTMFILALLISIIAETLIVNSAFAQMGPVMNGGPDFTPLSVNVISPLQNHLYNSNIELRFTVTKPASWFTSGAILYNYDCQGKVNFIRYSIDGEPSVTIPANDNYTGLSAVPIPTTLNYIRP